MTLFAILMLIQLIGLVFCAFVLRSNLPQTVHRVIRKNSKRLDGSISDRRRMIECASLERSFVRIYVGLAIIFAMTAGAGLVVAGVTIPLPNLDAIDEISNDPLQVTESPFDKMKWPLVSVYFVFSFMIAPVLIVNLYQSAVRHFYTRANLRFMDYYRQESVSQLPGREPVEKRPRPSRKLDENGPVLPRSAPFDQAAFKR